MQETMSTRVLLRQSQKFQTAEKGPIPEWFGTKPTVVLPGLAGLLRTKNVGKLEWACAVSFLGLFQISPTKPLHCRPPGC